MNKIAQFPPWIFVTKLEDLHVPGYTGYPDGSVIISKYLSANAAFGGNSNAGVLSAAVARISRARNDSTGLASDEYGRVFSGQGSRAGFIAVMQLINRHAAEFKKEPGLAKYFHQADFLQAMADDKCFGLDCIGFLGTYLVDAGLEAKYIGRRPLDYASVFKPVQSLSDVTDYSVVMLTNGLHIQMIDTVIERGNGYIDVHLCQSSTGGPQSNWGVRIRGGGGDYLPVEEFRAAVISKKYAQQHTEDNAKRKREGLGERDYETYLRALLKQSNTPTGYCGGAIFTITSTGEPSNPVSGSVYIGTAGISIGVP